MCQKHSIMWTFFVIGYAPTTPQKCDVFDFDKALNITVGLMWWKSGSTIKSQAFILPYQKKPDHIKGILEPQLVLWRWNRERGTRNGLLRT